jgi:hypothetical protein
MKRLTEEFILKHTTTFLLLGVNAVFWKGTERSSAASVTKHFPTFSLVFYEQYGSFSPISPPLALDAIKNKRVSLDQLTNMVRWDDFVRDVISFFRLNTHATQHTLDTLLVRFRKCFSHTTTTNPKLAAPAAKEPSAVVRAKLFFDQGCDALLVLLEFKHMIDFWATATGFEIASLLRSKQYTSDDDDESTDDSDDDDESADDSDDESTDDSDDESTDDSDDESTGDSDDDDESTDDKDATEDRETSDSVMEGVPPRAVTRTRRIAAPGGLSGVFSVVRRRPTSFQSCVGCLPKRGFGSLAAFGSLCTIIEEKDPSGVFVSQEYISGELFTVSCFVTEN